MRVSGRGGHKKNVESKLGYKEWTKGESLGFKVGSGVTDRA